MPSDERAAKALERCALHPGSPSVTRCDGCGRPLCLTCAVPVRGRVLGPECLSAALGPEVAPEGPTRAPHPDGRWRLTGLGFALASASTALPWSTFGEGTGVFGAWGRSPRWSLLAAVAAVLGLLAWLLRRRASIPADAPWGTALTVLAGLVIVGAALAMLRPPYAARVSFAPWLAAAGGAVVLAASLSLRRTASRGPRQRV